MTAQAPVLPGQRIEVRELGPLSAAELGDRLPEEGEDAVAAMPAISGAPGDAGCAGTRSSTSTARAPAAATTRSTAHRRGALRRRPARDGAAARPLQPRATYETGGGAKGNRPAGSVVQLKSAVPYVDKVTNPEPAAGGPMPRRSRRCARAGRGSSATATAPSRSPTSRISRARRRRGSRACSASPRPAVRRGPIGVVVVPASDARQPIPSVELLARVQQHVGAAAAGRRPLGRRPGLVADRGHRRGRAGLARAGDRRPGRGAGRGRGVPPPAHGRAARRGLAVRPPAAPLRPARADRARRGRRPRPRAGGRADADDPPPVPAALLVYSADHTITMAGSTERRQHEPAAAQPRRPHLRRPRRGGAVADPDLRAGVDKPQPLRPGDHADRAVRLAGRDADLPRRPGHRPAPARLSSAAERTGLDAPARSTKRSPRR